MKNKKSCEDCGNTEDAHRQLKNLKLMEVCKKFKNEKTKT